MPPRIRPIAQIGRRVEETSDRASHEPSPTVRGRGRGRTRGRGRGRGRGRAEEEVIPEVPPQEATSSAPEAPEWAQNLQRTLNEFMSALVQQRQPATAPEAPAPPSPPHAEQDSMSFRNYLQEFRKLKPPRYSGIGSTVDP